MNDENGSHELVLVLRETMVALVRKDGPDLSARQMSILLICYLEPEADQTVRGLALKLKVSKPAITRALDRLSDLDLVRREQDKRDLRSILVKSTLRGQAFMTDLRGLLTNSISYVEKISIAA